MKITKSRGFFIKTTSLSILLVLALMTGCAPRIASTIDVPVGDDLTTTAVEGTVWGYMETPLLCRSLREKESTLRIYLSR